MTEKQYSLVYYADKGGAFIKNNETGTEWYHDSRASLLEIVNELNGLTDENEQLKKENKELKIHYNNIREQRNEFHRGARENANRVGKLEKENKELKEENEWLKQYSKQVLQNHLNGWRGVYNPIDENLVVEINVIKSIAEDLGVDLE